MTLYMNQSYSQKIIDHYRHPLNTGKLKHADFVAEQINDLCGDEIKVYLSIKNNIIKDIGHEARGCMILIASASLLSEFVKGKTLSTVKKITKKDIDKLLGVRISRARESCAILALIAIQNATKS